ncbi:MAG: 3'-5' exonuclease [Gammaproteobacteria bacterium]|nr:3'-5' exonuclease [Gammaproteobacteria bacterium]
MRQSNLNAYGDEIYVLDTETTGLKGIPMDHVVDIAIASANIETGEVKPIFQSVVGYDIRYWTESARKAWVFENTDLTLMDVQRAPRVRDVAKQVLDLLKGHPVTSYNVSFDFGKFLYSRPWDLYDKIILAYDPMKAAAQVCKLPPKFEGADYKWPSLQHAYQTICPDDPAGMNGGQDHRAMSDAIMAAYLTVQMYNDGTYDPAIK